MEYRVISADVKSFKKDKVYLFNGSKVTNHDHHKWIDLVEDHLVNVKMAGLGHVQVNHPYNGLQNYPVLPKWCKEIEVIK